MTDRPRRRETILEALREAALEEGEHLSPEEEEEAVRLIDDGLPDDATVTLWPTPEPS